MNKQLIQTKKNLAQSDIFAFFIIIISVFLCVTFCSQSSPLYVTNLWDDANCFFTVGKSISNGLVLYRDIFEQKGPFLYFLMSAAYHISSTGFFGLYIIELITGILFMIISYKTLRLLTESNITYLLPIICAVIYTSHSFCQGGSVEELCLPCLAISNYYAIRAILKKQPLKLKEWFVIGVVSGFILWAKYSLLGFFIGYGLFFLVIYIKNGWNKDLIKSILALLGGVAVISIPVFVYFIANNSLSDLFEVYFYNNLIVYPQSAQDNFDNIFVRIAVSLGWGLGIFMAFGIICFFLVALCFMFTFKLNKQLFKYCITTFLISFIVTYVGGMRFIYYSFSFCVYVPIGALYIDSLIKKIKLINQSSLAGAKHINKIVPIATLVVAMTYTYFFTPNIFARNYDKEDYVQYQFDKTISKKENPTLLNFSFMDGGFYTYSNITPNCKYFTLLNANPKGIIKIQEGYLKEGLVDFVVTKQEQLPEYLQGKYELVDSKTFLYNKIFNLEETFTYYLYEKK